MKKTKRPFFKYLFAILIVLNLSNSSFIYADNSFAKVLEKIDQNTKVTGVVTQSNGEVLIGVSIRIKGTSIGTITDVDGRFILNASQDAVLQVSYIGFKTKEITIKGEKEILIVLQEDTELLDELVVVGYGIQKKASVTGSVASIQSKELVNVKSPNLSNMLAGRLPGLRAAQRSGAPGDDGASVDIRGYGNMLVIVDGIEREYSQINPIDIESISILKDASAAVYGFKGANGVLLITTKQGELSKPKMEYNGYIGFQKITSYPKLMNAYQYASIYNEAIYNSDPWNGIAAYGPNQLESYKNGSLGTNWWDEFARSTMPQYSNNLNISGGTEKVKYYTSIGSIDQQGMLKSNDWNFKRYNVRSNINIEVVKGFNIDLKLGGRYDKRNRPFEADELFQQSQMAVPIYSIYANNNPDYWQAIGDRPNPIHTSQSNESGYEKRMRREFNSSLALTWELPWIQGLQAKALIAYDYENTEWKVWGNSLTEHQYNEITDEYKEINLREKASLESRLQNYSKPTYQVSLNYNKSFLDKHDISGLLLFEMYNSKNVSTSGFKEFTLGLIPDLDYGDKANQVTRGLTQEEAHAGLVGRLNYAFNSRYLLEFNFRYDASYKFRSQDRWGFFPGISFGWRISEEDFFKNISSNIDNLKIRGSYANIGDEGTRSNFSPFQYLEGYEYGGSYIMGGEDIVTLGLRPSSMANPWLTWFESKIVNIGFEASYKRGLLSLEFDWFRRKRDGLPAIRTGSLPTTFGEKMPLENLNSDLNTGFEIQAGHNYKVGEFKYNVSANFSVSRNRDKYIERVASTNSYNNWKNNNNNRNKDIQWGRKVIGQFISFEEILNSPIQDNNGNKTLIPGDLKFEDFNKDGIIDDADSQPIGHGTTPRMYYGFNMGAEFKNFDLSVFFQGAAGHTIFLSGDILDPFIQQGLGNGFAIMTDRWHREDSTDPYSKWIKGTMPAARVTGQVYNRSSNSWSLHKGDYLRLKSLELGYNLPKKTISNYGIERLRVYFNGNNLFTFSSREGLMKNVDPESNHSRLRYYPQVKTFNFGLNLTF